MADTTDLKSVAPKEREGSTPSSGTINMELYYRYHEIAYSDSRICVFDTEYPVLKHTPKGVWIEEYPGKKRFVLKGARKKFACSTRKEALESFRARKKRQIKILEARLKKAKAALEAEPGNPVLIWR